MRRLGFIWKLLVGAYLIFVGVTLLNTILEVRPGNQEVMCGIAAVFILVGAGYLIGLLVGVVRRIMENRERTDSLEMDPPYSAMPARDQSLFRTAPMILLDEDDQSSDIQEGSIPKPEQDQKASVSPATVRLQTVGPDTTVWKK
ncbi:hypothetical protein [Schaedlerella arabinosiphila]|uniref:hypothetical protein n=1 Tax=Schaedlerella arabinosiphila TaxID=2044587 RepID=UPI002557D755|nr:hypothetical protein [Schaedlerella arabinosiphila]